MKFKIHKTYLALTLIIFLTEVCITIFLTKGFIRYTFGDFLAVILIYCSIRTFVEINPIYIAIGVLVIAFTVEFLQLFNILDHLQLRQNKLATIILGSTFHIYDLIAYTLGTVIILAIDLKTTQWEP